MTRPESTALMAYLRSKDELYYGKVLELRDAVRGWLNYIPQTFPHYTLHTAEHSDEILLQVSKILFEDDDPLKPSVHLSGVEAYIVAAAAYLHDAGMVASDREKAEILGSDSWRTWTSGEEPGARRWEEIRKFRRASDPPDESVRNFLADLQTRFLMAEFVRRTHHVRATAILAQYQSGLGRFAFDDPLLLRMISNVCLSHGLQSHELEDQERYPDRSDARGELVNVRFVSLLLRLADLLDLSIDRACPLVLNAACPLPADSYAHWTKYQRIIHRLTAPDRVELIAECANQDEHRFLQDWCQWLVDEIRRAGTIMSRSQRHSNWRPPRAELEGPSATIVIRPSTDATYIPSRWSFELDHDAVFRRLIFDIHETSQTFVRELIQNALDATRCQMYLDLKLQGIRPPSFPTQVPEEVRGRYPIAISLREVHTVNPMSGEPETRQTLSA